MSNDVLDQINQLVQRLWKMGTQSEKNDCIENLIQNVCAKIWKRENLPEQPYYDHETPLRGWQEALFEIRRQERRSMKHVNHLTPTVLEMAIRTSLRSIIPSVSSTSNWGDTGDYYYFWFKLPGHQTYADISFHRPTTDLYWDLYLPKHLLSSLGERCQREGYKRERNTLYKPINLEDGFEGLTQSQREKKFAKAINKLLEENARLSDARR